jgi:hypothetical protein
MRREYWLHRHQCHYVLPVYPLTLGHASMRPMIRVRLQSCPYRSAGSFSARQNLSFIIAVLLHGLDNSDMKVETLSPRNP